MSHCVLTGANIKYIQTYEIRRMLEGHVEQIVVNNHGFLLFALSSLLTQSGFFWDPHITHEHSVLAEFRIIEG